jgi:enediyne biosynthesis protein CalE5
VTCPGDEWGGASDGWRGWWAIFESALEPVNSALVDLVDLHAGHRILDVATGFGEPALTAARRVGSPGSVVVADSEDHDLPDASFDAALCRFGLSFVSDLAGTLKRLLVLLAPTGRLAAAVWGPPARCPALSIPLTTMRQYTELPCVPPGAPGPFGLGGEGVIEDELNFAGFADVESRRLAVVFEWTSPEAFARFHEAVADPIYGLAIQPGNRRDEMWEALLGAARAKSRTEGGVRLEAEVVVVVGRRPAREFAADR